MLQALQGNNNSDNIEKMISSLSNTLNGLLQGENNNRKALIDAINSLKKE
ncbi:hypothetical protein J2S08_002551 [Bacillus chungangensis]|uniref:Uncharacterized protein n=1 Tax=Bacillus chungangensis TaxID=587633 RepID=A0ABT9WTR5_9BACI|nr:hypothetical protein [Bacillus chungangensis]